MDKNIKLSWLAGIIEGEGSFCLNKSSGKRKHFVFKIYITNTDLIILNECKNILAENNIPCTLCQRKIYFKHRKVGYNLTVNGLGNLIKTIDLLLPYLIGQKKSQAKIMLDFLRRRKYLADKNIGHSARRIAYDEVDYAYLKSLEALKNISESVETTRSPSQRDEDIVRATHINKSVDSSRNDLNSYLNLN